jgi:transposase-like protein
MRYPAHEKLEIIRLVEQSHLPARRTLCQLGVPPATFYRWYDRYQSGGSEALADRPSRPDRVWNRIPEPTRDKIIDLALAEPELSPRELAVRFSEQQRYFVSEALVYRLLKAHDLITSPAFIVVKAAEEFHTKTHSAQPAVADRLHLPQGHRLGLVLSLHRARRLLTLRHRLEALHRHGRQRCHRDAEDGAHRLRLHPGPRPAPPAAALRQRALLHCR